MVCKNGLYLAIISFHVPLVLILTNPMRNESLVVPSIALGWRKETQMLCVFDRIISPCCLSERQRLLPVRQTQVSAREI